MSDEDALLAAITAHPDEDTPRLAYADWLDENERSVRAEFIRLQCQIKDLETAHAGEIGRSAALSGRVHLWRRQEELITHHRQALGPLGAALGPHRLTFDRGFVAEIDLAAPLFLAHAGAIVGLRPPPAVIVSGAVDCCDELFATPALSAVTRLEMRTREWRRERLDAVTVCRLGEIGGHNRIRELDLSGCQLTDMGLTYLAEYDSTWKMDTLDLSRNQIEEAGVRDLLRSALPGRLQRLSLSHNPLTEDAVRELVRDWPVGSPLKYLGLEYIPSLPRVLERALDERFGNAVLY